jgi:hypothetical protein
LCRVNIEKAVGFYADFKKDIFNLIKKCIFSNAGRRISSLAQGAMLGNIRPMWQEHATLL